MSGIGPRVKGVTLRSAAQAFRDARPDHYEAAIEAMPSALAEGLRYGSILASSWYPLAWYRELHAAIIAITQEGEAVIREIERSACRADMTGVYRIAFKLISPQTLISLSSRLFSTYYDTGKVETVEARSGYVKVRWRGCTGFNRSIWVGIFASCEEMLSLAGAKAIRIHVRAGGQGEDFADAEAFWT